MKKFILYISVTVFVYFFLLEITTRVFDLSGHTLPEYNLNNNKLLRPGAEGTKVQGGMREVASHYKINQQGFNSLICYKPIENIDLQNFETLKHLNKGIALPKR